MELLTTAEMAGADQLTIAAGTSGAVLMENAGRAVAAAVAGRRPAGPVVVVVGPGNNGGDGFVAARILAEQGFQVKVALFGDRAALKGDAAAAAARWTGPLEAAEPGAVQGAALIVDALFGAGLNRPVEGRALAIIEAMSAETAPSIAIDVPSGISGDTGAVMGAAAVKAVETVTFFRRKPGHLLMPGRLHCGTVKVADIGISSAVLDEIRPQTWANEPDLWLSKFPRPSVTGHKYNRGHAVVVSGEMPSTGAARLAARGALRAGAGLVTIASPMSALAAHAAESIAVMVREVDGPAVLGEFLKDRRRNAVVLGPGGGVGEAMRKQVAVALASGAATVLDADALTSFADDPEGLHALIGADRQRAVVATPHSGEFYILFNKIHNNYNLKSKLEETRLAAQQIEAIVILKGADTTIAAPDGRAAITSNAPAILATAGSGDVLAGIVGGLLAQGMPGFEAACAAVWLHGEAANEFGPGLISEDLPDTLPRVYRRLFA
ncbi:MAG TPA: NAD(P)H-hydrate dehydratase [Pseudolabrys sp.]|nr:NAD(P)H-hydrate dehydratase [Pseudolabrys sp.]